MPRITIAMSSRRLGKCRTCGAAIEWAVNTRTGKAIPFNPPIVLTTSLLDSLISDARTVDLEQTTAHFATCPHAEQWRKP